MILSIPASRWTQPVVIGLYAVDRWERFNPHLVVIVGTRQRIRAILGVFSRLAPHDHPKRVVWKRFG